MSRIVKLQKVGNSIRATIPKEVANNLSLSEGDEVIVDAKNSTVIIRKRSKHNMARFYGILGERKGEVEHWPTPEEIKDIWE